MLGGERESASRGHEEDYKRQKRQGQCQRTDCQADSIERAKLKAEQGAQAASAGCDQADGQPILPSVAIQTRTHRLGKDPQLLSSDTALASKCIRVTGLQARLNAALEVLV